MIGLLKIIKNICYNFQSHKYSPHAIHDALHKLYVQAQYLSTLATDYLKKLQTIIDVIDSVGATIGVHSQLIKEKVDQIHSMHATDTVYALAKLDSKCEELSKEHYLAIAYLMSSNHRRYGNCSTKCRTTTPGGTTNGPAPW